jgi:hypothetical protein
VKLDVECPRIALTTLTGWPAAISTVAQIVETDRRQAGLADQHRKVFADVAGAQGATILTDEYPARVMPAVSPFQAAPALMTTSSSCRPGRR